MRILVLFWALIGLCIARPPAKPLAAKPGGGETKPAGNGTAEDWDLNIEYNRYLQEVVQVLESDPEFRKKLETADVDAIRDGTIAHELDFVQHGVRSKLDDIKRRELERLRHLFVKQNEINQGIDKKHLKIPQHLDVRNPKFDVSDLKKLIKSTTEDLEKADRERRDDFKRYEMEKKFEEEERLKHIEDEAKRAEEQKRLDEAKAKHKDHGKVHHPMTKDQLEEVWEEADHMRPEDWNPKTFFAMHDLNGDNYWDEDEIRVLFRKELDKVYDPNEPEDDMKEREEEMERMREHVFKESATKKDHLISFDEFMTETKRDEFEKDPGWDTMDQDEDEEFSDDEFRAYQAQRQREIEGLINQGQVPPGYPYFGNVPPGAMPYELPNQAGAYPGHGGVPGSIPGQQAFRQDPNFQQQNQPQFGQPPPMGHPQMGQGQPQMGRQQQPQFQQQQPPPQQFQGQPPPPHQFQGQPQQFQGQPPPPQQQQFQGQPPQQQQFQQQQPPRQMGQPLGQPQKPQPPQEFHQDLKPPPEQQKLPNNQV